MKKIYLISSLALVMMTSCKKDPTTNVDANTTNDTTTIKKETTVDSANTASVEKPAGTTDPATGKLSISENKWVLSELNGAAVTNNTDKDYFISLDSELARFSGFTGCNTVEGDYQIVEAGKLLFANVNSTKVACDQTKMENEFISALKSTDSYMIEGDILQLQKGKTVVAKFAIKK